MCIFPKISLYLQGVEFCNGDSDCSANIETTMALILEELGRYLGAVVGFLKSE